MANHSRLTTKEEATETLCRILAGDEWKTALFADRYLPFDHVYEPEETVRRAPIFPYGGFNSKTRAESDLKDCLCAGMDAIAEWAVGNKRTFRMEFAMEQDVGYTIDSPTAEKRYSSTLVLALRRDKENLTPFGFFVSGFTVI